MNKNYRRELVCSVVLAAVTVPAVLLGQTNREDTPGKGCTVRGEVIWKYNEYVGYRPDVRAKVILLRRFKEKLVFRPFFSETDKAKGVYVTEVDLSGKYEVNVTPGTYDLLMVSKSANRHLVRFDPSESPEELSKRAQLTKGDSYSVLNLTESLELLKLAQFKKAILIPHVAEDDYELAYAFLLHIKKYSVEEQLKCKRGEVLEQHVDFGTTFF